MFFAVILFQAYINIDALIANKAGKVGFGVFVMSVCGLFSCRFNILFIFGSDIALSGCTFMIIGKGVG
jgi:hypothetical protein